MQAITIVTMLALAATAALAGHIEDHHHHPIPYKFAYEVHDGHHGDVKSHHESGHGGQVKGFYSLVEPDGHVRKVEYTADKHSGFQAVVTREGKTTHHGYGDLDGNGLGAGAGYGAGIGAGAGHGAGYGAGHGAGYGAGIGAGYGAGIGAGYGAGIGAGVGAGAGAGHGHLKGLPGVHGGNGAGYGAGYGAGLDAGHHGHHGHGY